MWLKRFFSSSIGKKYLMASSGLLLLLFLVTHAMGNCAIFVSSKAFQKYADTLHNFPVIVSVLGFGLLLTLILHIFLGLQLSLKNKNTTKSRYMVPQKVENKTFAASTMIYSGGFILLYLLVHVCSFGYPPEGVNISTHVKDSLTNFFYSLFYLVSFCVLALHLSHGFWSMLQTFGLNHPKYNSGISILTLVVPLTFLLIFGSIALYFMTGIGANY